LGAHGRQNQEGSKKEERKEGLGNCGSMRTPSLSLHPPKSAEAKEQKPREGLKALIRLRKLRCKDYLRHVSLLRKRGEKWEAGDMSGKREPSRVVLGVLLRGKLLISLLKRKRRRGRLPSVYKEK